MHVASAIYANTTEAAASRAVESEAVGYDSYTALETQLDPFVTSAVAAERTTTIQLATGIAVAFARNPMTVALQANDIHGVSQGRFALGLGSQIKPHITKRYSMEWSKPAARMNDFVKAIRAIWHTWATDEPLEHRGEFYTHTLMTPMFNPGPNPHGNPPIWLAAVGPLMTQTAGEVADGILLHSFSTEKYLREATIPALLEGRAQAGKQDLDGFTISGSTMTAVGDTPEELEKEIAEVKRLIGFYGSTPAYRPVLETHGWGDLQTELHELSKRGEWDRMRDAIPDEVLHTFAVIGTPEEMVDEVLERYGDVVTRMSIQLPENADPDRWRPLFDRLRQG